jgi:hypothetical protein
LSYYFSGLAFCFFLLPSLLFTLVFCCALPYALPCPALPYLALPIALLSVSLWLAYFSCLALPFFLAILCPVLLFCHLLFCFWYSFLLEAE